MNVKLQTTNMELQLHSDRVTPAHNTNRNILNFTTTLSLKVHEVSYEYT